MLSWSLYLFAIRIEIKDVHDCYRHDSADFRCRKVVDCSVGHFPRSARVAEYIEFLHRDAEAKKRTAASRACLLADDRQVEHLSVMNHA